MAIRSVEVNKITMSSSFTTGQKTVTSAGTAEALASSAAVATGVQIKALPDNTDYVYVGNSTVDNTNGIQLSPGDTWYVEVNDINKIYVDADTSGEGVAFQYSQDNSA